MRARPLWPLYAGGFMGPFGGAMTSVMLPELAEGLHTTVGVASTAVTWYMVPFATLMLASGTLAARWGEARTVRVAFVAYGVASLVGVLASSIELFLIGRALQGAANAFTTPLLISMLAALTPPHHRGRAIGTYSSMQAAGVAFAPLIGGAAASVSYRLAFALAAATAFALAALVPGVQIHHGAGPVSQRDRWRSLANRPLARVCLIGFALQSTATAVILLVSLLGADRFGLDVAQRGLLVALFGGAGLLAGRASGQLADRYGMRRVGAGALTLLGLGMAVSGIVPWLWLLAVVISIAGAGNAAARMMVQSLAVRTTPVNPSGATSLMLAVQFLGGALAPASIPPYQTHPALTCAAVGAVSLLGAALATRASADSARG